MKIDPDTYQDAALEHVELARELYEARRYVFALYAAGVSVECALRARMSDHEFDSRHDLRALLKESGYLASLHPVQAQRVAAAAGALWARWRNTHRYFSAARLKRFLVDGQLHRRVKGDPVKENTRIAVNSALTILGEGVPTWIR